MLELRYKKNKHCKDGRDRSLYQFYFNNALILEQKQPYDDNYSEGFNRRTEIKNIFLYQGKIYQTRVKDNISREVHFPCKRINTDLYNPNIKYYINDI